MSSATRNHSFPSLDSGDLSSTRDALHAYARILGRWTTACRARRKHWWHASLRPSLNGVTTGVIYADDTQFEIELSFRDSQLIVCTAKSESLSVELNGQPAIGPANQIRDFLESAGVPKSLTEAATNSKSKNDDLEFRGYSSIQANNMARALGAVSSAMENFRAGIREETSPIQLWPHHFDLSMIWLPGDKIADQDPADEENADKQMNFGFVFGDESVSEPYFYVTAYPTPEAFSALDLPEGTEWRSDGFTGAVLTWQTLLQHSDPAEYLLRLWNQLLNCGKQTMRNN